MRPRGTDVPSIMFGNGYDRGVADERALVLAFLRRDDLTVTVNPTDPEDIGPIVEDLAQRIEAGEHLPKPKGGA